LFYGIDENCDLIATAFDLVCSKRLRIYDLAEKAIELELMAAALGMSSLTKALS
jgi:hypothetical protein